LIDPACGGITRDGADLALHPFTWQSQTKWLGQGNGKDWNTKQECVDNGLF
jgi:hypothetical protein